jgi:hypothetical protein
MAQGTAKVISSNARQHPAWADHQEYFSSQSGGSEAYVVNVLISMPSTGIRWGFSWSDMVRATFLLLR